uniref:Glycosyl transferase family 25 domain-containing protein n=1 Tax=viral metagenome TaxID=1070528 RepID=A0A6C0K372_9ZZZZ
MNVFYINLDRRPERRQHMEEQLSRAGITKDKIKRVTAVDGATLNLHSSPLRSLFSSQVLKEAQEEGAASFAPGSKMTRGGLGCALSHRDAYQRLLERSRNNSSPGAIVLEDDVRLSDHFVQKAQSLIASAPPDYDILYLGYHESWANEPIPGGNATWMRPTKQVFGTFALYIRASSVPKILQALFPITAQLDSAYSRNFHRLHIYLPRPQDCIVWSVASMESDIQNPIAVTVTTQSKRSLLSIVLIVVLVLILMACLMVAILLSR